jgi:hypothetical protein
MSDNSFKNVKTYSRSEISAFSDKELHSVMHHIKTCIREARRRNSDTTRLEIEFCYLDNERQRREKWSFSPSHPSKKRDSHQKQTRNHRDRSEFESVPVKPKSYNR